MHGADPGTPPSFLHAMVRPLFFAFYACCVIGSHGQATLSTYYVIPPTSGCNGVWAFGPYSSLWATCTGPYAWLFDPFSCVDYPGGVPTNLNVVNDTIVMDLCSLPCEFLFYADTGLCAQLICGTVPLGQAEADPGGAVILHGDLLSSADPVLSVSLQALEPAPMMLLDAGGRVCVRRTVAPGESRIPLGPIAPGPYLVIFQGDGNWIVHRLLVQ